MNQESHYHRKLTELFPEQVHREAVASMLATDELQTDEQNPQRLQLAILKLAGATPSTATVRGLVNEACDKPRDILARAEYPRQHRLWFVIDPDANSEMARQDEQEYQDWLNS